MRTMAWLLCAWVLWDGATVIGPFETEAQCRAMFPFSTSTVVKGETPTAVCLQVTRLNP
jgi:hypothetical protein